MKFKNMIKYGFCFLAMGAMLTGCSEAPSVDRSGGNIGEVTPEKGDLIATFEIEGYGTIKAVLFPDIAPVGVENFQKLADDGFYKGLTIHRVVDEFMFQGGSTNGDGTGGDAAVNGGSFGVEADDNARHFYGALCYANAGGQNSTQFYIVNNKESGIIDNTVKMYDDTIAELTGLIEAASSEDEKLYYQYYQTAYTQARDKFSEMDDNTKALYNERGGTPSLDGDYTVFGQVCEGFDVIDSISKAEVVDNGGGEVSKPVQTITIKDITVTKYK